MTYDAIPLEYHESDNTRFVRCPGIDPKRGVTCNKTLMEADLISHDGRASVVIKCPRCGSFVRVLLRDN